MAITAWSAKEDMSSICRSLKGRTSDRVNASTPMGTAFAHHRHADDRAEFTQSLCFDKCKVGVVIHVRNVDDAGPQAARAR